MMISSGVLAGLTLVMMAVCAPAEAQRGFRRPRPSSPSVAYDALYDFQTNEIKTNGYVSVVSGFNGQGCSTRGVLKIALADATTDPSRRRVVIDLTFSNPTGWVFNLGDSSTNDGYAGDDRTQSNDGEVHGTGTTFSGYLSDNGGNGQAINIQNLYSTSLALIVGDGHITWLPDDSNKNNYYSNPALFALNGQSDATGPVNYDLYLGINQVITGRGDRVGSGLCRVGIRFLPAF